MDEIRHHFETMVATMACWYQGKILSFFWGSREPKWPLPIFEWLGKWAAWSSGRFFFPVLEPCQGAGKGFQSVFGVKGDPKGAAKGPMKGPGAPSRPQQTTRGETSNPLRIRTLVRPFAEKNRFYFPGWVSKGIYHYRTTIYSFPGNFKKLGVKWWFSFWFPFKTTVSSGAIPKSMSPGPTP